MEPNKLCFFGETTPLWEDAFGFHVTLTSAQAEMAPQNLRGTLTSMYNMMITSGMGEGQERQFWAYVPFLAVFHFRNHREAAGM